MSIKQYSVEELSWKFGFFRNMTVISINALLSGRGKRNNRSAFVILVRCPTNELTVVFRELVLSMNLSQMLRPPAANDENQNVLDSLQSL